MPKTNAETPELLQPLSCPLRPLPPCSARLYHHIAVGSSPFFFQLNILLCKHSVYF